MYDVVIVGSGPAGLSAAVYASRAELSFVVVEREFMGTGQIAVTDRVDNYLGLYGMGGYDLGAKFREHAEALGAEFAEGEVSTLEKTADGWDVHLEDGSVISGRAVIYAAGASNRRLGIKGADMKGVSYCAVCDGMFYKGKTVAVIGGGDTALGDALYLAKLAEKVYLIHRRAEFRGNMSLQKKIAETPNIELVLEAVPTEITGEGKVSAIVVEQKGESRSIPVDGVFTAIGQIPNTKPLEGVVELEGGYIRAGEDGRTSAEGLFAAGDVRTKALRQVITAASDGANCAISAEEYLR
ncbi:thioredoxin reductase (NADPH) [Ruminococcus sp. YE71]|uniref:NAD(P)/FAD-dependent oxidoreductase n=1 Tax=unclassified Ruminococcus TaxID=2608920 RepID=UPI00088B7C8E|nr:MULTISPECIES: FAD-dependent oxidoreductase [unclassified Ruminococcus]SDA12346.1 thioredoxin reductase (NADPH) [Ruminococcus sp. YE78]SFW16788.1 thioredoxin reductase (NADPH) [Ruminococcus sp. YE71]